MKRIITTLYATAALIVLWQILHLIIALPIIPAPLETFQQFIHQLYPTLLQHMGVSLYRITVALLISLVIGVGIGLLLGKHPIADRMFSPIIYLLYPLPKIAFLPVIMILFGLGDLSKIILIIFIIVFQFTIAVRDGIREIPHELRLSARSLDLTDYEMTKHLFLPATLPKIWTALRIGTGISISVLFFSENFATSYGIGYYIMNRWLMVNYIDMYCGIIALALLGYLLFLLIDIAEHQTCKWIYVIKDR